jgi:hypothetical protein
MDCRRDDFFLLGFGADFSLEKSFCDDFDADY